MLFEQKVFGPKISMSLVSIKVANGSKVQHMGTIPVRLGPVQLTCDYDAISVQLPTGTELGNKGTLFSGTLKF